MTELTDIDAVAGEYVLGTLDAGERRSAEARIERDPNLRQAVEAWQRRLSPLTETVSPISPPGNLYNKIRARIGLSQHVISLRTRERRLEQRANRWRNATAGFAALAASLVAVIGWRSADVQTTSTQYVAVLQSGPDKPAFLLTIDTGTHNCIISAIDAPKQPQKSYEVWMVSDQLENPKSLGTMAEGEMHVMPMQDGPDTDMFMDATFAVSLEPEGGSPTGTPTGPMLYQAKLFKATP